MSGGLREFLGLPEASQSTPSAQAGAFSKAFREGTTELNRDLQQVAATAGRAEHQELDAQRQKLYTAYQKTLAQIDPADPAKAVPAIERVLAAVKTVRTKASTLAVSAQSGRDEWLKREADFDAAITHIENLEDSQHAKAATFRKVRDAILARANGGNYQQASSALDQLQPKLNEVITQPMMQAGTDDGKVDSGDGASVKPTGAGSDHSTGGSGANRGGVDGAATAKTSDSKQKGKPTREAKPKPRKTPKTPPARKGQITDANVNYVTGMSTFLTRLEKAGLTLNELNLTPDRVVEILNTDPVGGIKDLNKRLDTAIEHHVTVAQMGRQVGPLGKVDVRNNVGPGEKKLTRDGTVDGVFPSTPKKTSPTGRAVIERMRSEGKIVGTRPNEMVYHAPTKKWYPIAETQMGHVADAVKWWTNVGQYYGAKSELVKEWWQDPNIYELEPSKINASKGGKEAERYSAPHPDPITKDELAGKIKKRPDGSNLSDKNIEESQQTQYRDYKKRLHDYQKRLGEYDAKAKDFKARKDAHFSEFESRRKKAAATQPTQVEMDAWKPEWEAGERLRVEESALRAQGKSLIREGQNLSAEIEKASNSLKGQRGSTTIGGMVSLAVTAATALVLAIDIMDILEAATVEEQNAKAKALIDGTIEGAVKTGFAQAITKTGPIRAGLAVEFFLNLCDGSECDRQKQEQQRKELRKARSDAIGEYLEAEQPGSVRWDVYTKEYVVKDQERWDQAAAQAMQVLMRNMREAGYYDGLAGKQWRRTALEQGPSWDDQEKIDMLSAYDAGYASGEAQHKMLVLRARELGLKDGTAGQAGNLVGIQKWPEIVTLVEQVGTEIHRAALTELQNSYKSGFDSMAPESPVPAGPDAITAGEAVARDKRAAALKRATELGKQDGKSGKPANVDEIRSWPEVETKELNQVETAARMKLLQELLDAYHTAFAAAAPPGVIGQGASNITAGDAVELDKKAARLRRASQLGVNDGLAGRQLHKDGIVAEAPWESVELLKTYEASFNEGETKKSAALKSVRELGTQDGKAGTPVHMEEINEWPIVLTPMPTEVAVQTRAAFQIELVAAYKKAFDIATGNVTAGEKVAIDKKEAALKKARELGLKDGKTGNKAHVEEIQKWPEVTEVEASARGTFLAELIEAYNKAFASVAPAGAATPVASNLSAGEKVDRDKKSAALKQAREWGLKDGKTGKKSHLEEFHTWPEVTELGEPAGVAFHGQLVVAYNKAFASVAPATPALLQRARDLAEQDAKTGMATRMSEISKWPEAQENAATLQQLLDAYNKAFGNAMAAAK